MLELPGMRLDARPHLCRLSKALARCHTLARACRSYRDQGQNHDSWVSMPTVLAAGAICTVLNRDGRRSVGRKPCVEVIAARAYLYYTLRRKR